MITGSPPLCQSVLDSVPCGSASGGWSWRLCLGQLIGCGQDSLPFLEVVGARSIKVCQQRKAKPEVLTAAQPLLRYQRHILRGRGRFELLESYRLRKHEIGRQHLPRPVVLGRDEIHRVFDALDVLMDGAHGSRQLGVAESRKRSRVAYFGEPRRPDV